MFGIGILPTNVIANAVCVTTEIAPDYRFTISSSERKVMDSSIGKTNAPALSLLAPAPSVVSPPAAPAAVPQENFDVLNALPRDLKAYIAKLAGPEANKALRLTNSSFRQAVAE